MNDIALPTTRSRFRWSLWLPFILLLVFCLAWAGLWLYGRMTLIDIMDREIAREAGEGRNWSCPDRSVSGFPFRMELRCAEPRFAAGTPEGDIEASVKGVTAVARVLDPFAVIMLFDGPLTLTQNGRTGTLNWKEARASVRATTTSLSSFDTVALGLDLMLPLPAADQPLTATAERLEAHMRQHPGSVKDGKADFDLVANLKTLNMPLLGETIQSEAPIDLEIQTQALAVPLKPGRGPEGIDAWRDGGGSLKLVLVKLVNGASSLEATGALKLDAERRLEGTVNLVLANLDRFADALGNAGALARPLLKKGNAPLNLGQGKLSFGPFPIADLPPLY
jgi:hypothetical protein